MDPQGLKLPFSDEAFELNPDLEKIWRVLWRVDPARLRLITEEVQNSLFQINMEYTVQSARLVAQMKTLEADTLQRVQEQINKTKLISG